MARAVVDLPQPDSPTRPNDSCRPMLERDVPQGQAVACPARDRSTSRWLTSRVDRRLLDDGGQVGGSCEGHWTSTASIASPMRFMAMTSEAIASAGKSVSHQ